MQGLLLGTGLLVALVSIVALVARARGRRGPAPALPASVQREVRRALGAHGFRAATALLKERYGFTEVQSQIAVGLVERADAVKQRRLTGAWS
jgi:hypothetical protein